MKFNFLRKKSNVECIKCGKKFKNEVELTDHNHTAHGSVTQTRKLRPTVIKSIFRSNRAL
jgi:hypothetical protein